MAKSTELAVVDSHYHTSEILAMADAAAKSGLFPGIKTREQAFALMMLCEAKKLHPMVAMERYHIIQGRPAMKADAMLAEFQAQGGKVRWVKWDDVVCQADFSHPQYHPEPVRIEWTMPRAKTAGLTGKDNWKQYPAAMLRARAISEGVRMVHPAAVVGIYTVEEAIDMIPEESAGNARLKYKLEEKKPAESAPVVVDKATFQDYASIVCRGVRRKYEIDCEPQDLARYLVGRIPRAHGDTPVDGETLTEEEAFETVQERWIADEAWVRGETKAWAEVLTQPIAAREPGQEG